MSDQKFILWDAANARQMNFDTAADLNHALFGLGLEVPDSLNKALSKGFRPKNPV